jgi:hypothetical protein
MRLPGSLSCLLLTLLGGASVNAQTLESLNQQLPKSLQFSGEYRARWEGFENQNYSPGFTDDYLLSRLRLNLSFTPSEHLQFFAQAQDAHVLWNSRIPDAPPYQDSMDLRLLWAEIGNSQKDRFALRVGRQEINIGEERLVGSSNWLNTARSFDAVRLYWNFAPKAHAEVFASSVVVQADGPFNKHRQGDNLHGATAVIERAGLRWEPFGLWRVSPSVRSESGTPGRLDFKTIGTRLLGSFGKQTDFVTEMAIQTGSWGADSLSSWAGHWRVVRRFSSDWRIPSLRVEYDYASGDKNPNDGQHETFELLYPTPHDKMGLADQVGWKNIHHAGAILEWVPSKSVTLQLKGHEWWLASAKDGVYNAGGTLISRDSTGRSGRHVGQEVDVQVLTSITKNFKLGGGLGHIFPGEFLRRTTPGDDYTFPYLMATVSF